jgi:DNA-binding CsgD family transcriptional regulator
MNTEVDRVIGLFYEAAVTPTLWGDALAALADATGATDAHIIALDKSTGRPILAVAGARGVMREFLKPYFESWATRDPLIPKMISMPKPPGSLMLCHEYLSRREVARNEYFQDFAIPCGVRYQAAWVLEDNSTVHAVVDLTRSKIPFDRALLARWNGIASHLQRAVRMSMRFAEKDVFRQAVDRGQLMYLVVDSVGHVRDQSAAAAALLNRGDLLRVIHGRLMAATAEKTRTLHRSIAAAARGVGGGALSLGVDPQRICRLEIAPAGVSSNNPFSPLSVEGAIIYIQMRVRRRVPQDTVVRARLQCTLAEAQVAVALTAGQSPKQIADARRVSINTIRTQIRALFASTDTKRISELVALVVRL